MIDRNTGVDIKGVEDHAFPSMPGDFEQHAAKETCNVPPATPFSQPLPNGLVFPQRSTHPDQRTNLFTPNVLQLSMGQFLASECILFKCLFQERPNKVVTLEAFPLRYMKAILLEG